MIVENYTRVGQKEREKGGGEREREREREGGIGGERGGREI